MINEKYRTKDYHGAQDWIAEFMRQNVYIRNAEGEVTGDMDVEKALDLLEKNAMPEAAEKYRNSNLNKGQIRMNVGNRLRGAARRRGGIFDSSGEWIEAPDDFEVKLRENPDGTKIAKAKAEEKEDA